MRQVKIEELEKGDLILCRWNDASELRAGLEQHKQPAVHVKDWGVFLGIAGAKRKHIVVGKDVVEIYNEWGAARIPVELVNKITLIMKREELIEAITEIQALTRRVRLRKYARFTPQLGGE